MSELTTQTNNCICCGIPCIGELYDYPICWQCFTSAEDKFMWALAIRGEDELIDEIFEYRDHERINPRT